MKPQDFEHEQKYLVKDLDVLEAVTDGTSITQGYLPTSTEFSVRVRLLLAQDICLLTVKGRRLGLTRAEAECEVPREIAELLILACGDRVVEKTRHPVLGEDGRLWVIDVFHGLNEGLVLAEIELQRPEEDFERPSWCGEEVTDDERYYNEYLADNPYSTW